jgi:hypothetical protein
MNNLPTAEEFLNSKSFIRSDLQCETNYQLMIEFAKMHCEAQLKAILENVQISWENDIIKNAYENNTWADEESIINAYPIDNIK